jgi:hypothetical protein
MRRSKVVKAIRFGAFLRSTLSWWRSATISASSEARDRNSPMTTHEISLSISPMRRSIARFALMRQWDRVYDKDNGRRGKQVADEIDNVFQIIGEPDPLDSKADDGIYIFAGQPHGTANPAMGLLHSHQRGAKGSMRIDANIGGAWVASASSLTKYRAAWP